MMSVRQLSAASVILAAMSVMAEGVWAEDASGPAKTRHAPHKAAVHRHRLAASPAPPAPGTLAVRGESGFEPAPTPNDDVGPVDPGRPARVTAEPHMFGFKTQYRGDGYPYGATPQGIDNRNSVEIPGVVVTAPLHETLPEGIR